MHTTRLNIAVLLITSSLAMAGCVSVPKAIDHQPDSDISVADVQQNETLHTTTQVRWGGTIVGLTNNSDTTDILVVSRSLSKNTRPRRSDRSSGRFIARVSGFVEPEVYVNGREVTITGTVSRIENQLIGSTEYPYPVVIVDGIHLWTKRDATRYKNPYHVYPYDPFFHPHRHWWDHDHRSGTSINGHIIFRREDQ